MMEIFDNFTLLSVSLRATSILFSLLMACSFTSLVAQYCVKKHVEKGQKIKNASKKESTGCCGCFQKKCPSCVNRKKIKTVSKASRESDGIRPLNVETSKEVKPQVKAKNVIVAQSEVIQKTESPLPLAKLPDQPAKISKKSQKEKPLKSATPLPLKVDSNEISGVVISYKLPSENSLATISDLEKYKEENALGATTSNYEKTKSVKK